MAQHHTPTHVARDLTADLERLTVKDGKNEDAHQTKLASPVDTPKQTIADERLAHVLASIDLTPRTAKTKPALKMDKTHPARASKAAASSKAPKTSWTAVNQTPLQPPHPSVNAASWRPLNVSQQPEQAQDSKQVDSVTPQAESDIGHAAIFPTEAASTGIRKERRVYQTPRHAKLNSLKLNTKTPALQQTPWLDTWPSRTFVSNIMTKLHKQIMVNRAALVPKPGSDRKKFLLPLPQPSVQYMIQALQPPVLLNERKKLLVILDLNGTLVHRKNKSPTGGFKRRPFFKEFLRYVTTEHHVMIWSSAREHNVERLCKQIFEEVGIPKPANRWCRNNFGLPEKWFEMNIQIYKQLTWVWNDKQIKDSSGREFSQADTILIDDTIEKAASEPFNLLRIDEFDGTDMETDVLGKVVEYLERLRSTNDVSSYVCGTPFAFDAAQPAYQWPRATPVADGQSKPQPA